MSKEYLSLLNITYHYLILLMHQFAEEKRRERDSNPRYGCPYTDLANQRLQPLGHLSLGGYIAAQPLPGKGSNRPRGRIRPNPIGPSPARRVRRKRSCSGLSAGVRRHLPRGPRYSRTRWRRSTA